MEGEPNQDMDERTATREGVDENVTEKEPEEGEPFVCFQADSPEQPLHLSVLPPELICAIIRHLPFRDRVNLRVVCRVFSILACYPQCGHLIHTLPHTTDANDKQGQDAHLAQWGSAINTVRVNLNRFFASPWVVASPKTLLHLKNVTRLVIVDTRLLNEWCPRRPDGGQGWYLRSLLDGIGAQITHVTIPLAPHDYQGGIDPILAMIWRDCPNLESLTTKHLPAPKDFFKGEKPTLTSLCIQSTAFDPVSLKELFELAGNIRKLSFSDVFLSNQSTENIDISVAQMCKKVTHLRISAINYDFFSIPHYPLLQSVDIDAMGVDISPLALCPRLRFVKILSDFIVSPASEFKSVVLERFEIQQLGLVKNVAQLQDLQYLRKSRATLTRLMFFGSFVNLDVLPTLHALRKLHLSDLMSPGLQISLSNHPFLETLVLEEIDTVRSLGPTPPTSRLKHVTLKSCKLLADISALANCQSLTHVTLKLGALRDVSCLRGHVGLQNVHLVDMVWLDVQPLRACPNIRVLRMD